MNFVVPKEFLKYSWRTCIHFCKRINACIARNEAEKWKYVRFFVELDHVDQKNFGSTNIKQVSDEKKNAINEAIPEQKKKKKKT